MNKDTTKKSEIKSWIIDVLIAVVIAVCIMQFVRATVVVGDSMNPNFEDGDRLFTTRVFSIDSLKKGDVVTFIPEGETKTYIKRVIGLPGDRVKISDGKVFINGKEDDQSYTNDQETDVDDDSKYTDVVVPDNAVYCLGDNRLNSEDSRVVGYATLDRLKGKVRLRFWPLDRISTDINVYK